MEPFHEGNAEPDHQAAHYQRAENSPNQDAMLRSPRHPEIGEDQDENKNVIDAKGVLDDVAGEKIEPGVVAFGFPNQQVESERQPDLDKAALDRGAHA